MENLRKGVIYAIVTAVLWGFLAVALKVGSQHVDSVTIVWFRFTLAFSVLLAYHLVKKPNELKILIRPPLILVIAALGLAWNYMGFMLGIEYTSPANTQVVIQTGPITLALIGIIFFRERMNLQQMIGFALAVIGLAFFYHNQLKLMFDAEAEYNKGFVFILSGAFAWVIYAVMQKKLVMKYSAASLNLFLFGLPVILFFPFTDLQSLTQLHWGWWLLLVAFGLNTLVAYGSLALALKYIEASKVSIIIVMNPIITFVTMAILSYLEVSWIPAEKFSVLTILGALIVLAGAVLVIRKKK